MGPESTDNRIDAALRMRPAGLWPFLAAGYPDPATTADILRRLDGLPIRGVELGFPFSDSIADGPVIQAAFTRSLAAGVTVQSVFKMVASVRPTIRYPLVAMVSASIIYRIGVREFMSKAASAGFDGLLAPDLSLGCGTAALGCESDVAQPPSAVKCEFPGMAELAECARSAGLRLCMLIAPTTPPDRQKRIAAVASGFLYYVSVQGVTGERDRLPVDLAGHVNAVREATGRPVLVGFGISRPDQVREVCSVADGAIVGSAVVRCITELLDSNTPWQVISERAAELIAQLCVP